MQRKAFKLPERSKQEEFIIAAAFITHFNEQTGPKLITKYPKSFNLLNDVSLNCFSDYIIPKPELCGSIITVEFSPQFYITGLPCEIYNEKYKRKKVEFNFGFIISKSSYSKYKLSIKQILRNAAKIFISLEINSSFIYDEKDELLNQTIKQIYEDLNFQQESIIITPDQTLHLLKLQENPVEQIKLDEIKPNMVPMLVKNIKQLKEKIANFNPQFLSVIKEIDGVLWVKLIAKQLDMEVDGVKRYLQTLHTLKCIKFVSIIEFQNFYGLGENFTKLFHDNQLKKACRNYIQIKKLDENKSIRKIIDRNIIAFYFQFNKVTLLAKFLFLNNKKLKTINVVNFINFGIANKILKRYFDYPVNLQKTQHDFYKQDQKTSFLSVTIEDAKLQNKILNEMINQEFSLNEICVTLGKNRFDIQTLFQKTDIHFMLK